MRTALSLAKEARDSLGEYCIKICKAQCCQRGSLLLMTDNEVKAIVGNRQSKYLKSGILTYTNNNFLLYNSDLKVCKNLDKKKFMCKIYTETSRPLVCRDYPVFLVKDFVMFGQNCPAVQEGLLNDYKNEFEKLGIKVI